MGECGGYEFALCMYDATCRLVEEIFGGYRDAARQWMLKIMHCKRREQMQLLCKGCACHTLEALLFALSNTLDAEVQ